MQRSLPAQIYTGLLTNNSDYFLLYSQEQNDPQKFNYLNLWYSEAIKIYIFSLIERKVAFNLVFRYL